MVEAICRAAGMTKGAVFPHCFWMERLAKAATDPAPAVASLLHLKRDLALLLGRALEEDRP